MSVTELNAAYRRLADACRPFVTGLPGEEDWSTYWLPRWLSEYPSIQK